MDQIKAMMAQVSDEDLAAMFSADPELLGRVANAILTAADQGEMPGAREESFQREEAQPSEREMGMMSGEMAKGGTMGREPATGKAPSGMRPPAPSSPGRMGMGAFPRKGKRRRKQGAIGEIRAALAKTRKK